MEWKERLSCRDERGSGDNRGLCGGRGGSGHVEEGALDLSPGCTDSGTEGLEESSGCDHWEPGEVRNREAKSN
jgi:hypothetical protein